MKKKGLAVFLLLVFAMTLCGNVVVYGAKTVIWQQTFDEPGEEVGAVPTGWQEVGLTGGGSGFLISESGKSGRAAEFISDAGGRAICREFAKLTEPQTYEFTMDFMVAQDSDYVMQLNLTNKGGYQGPCMNIKANSISCDQEDFFADGTASSRAAGKAITIKKGSWQTMKLLLHLQTQTYDVYLDGVALLTGVYFRKKTATVIEEICVIAGDGSAAGLRHLYFDSMKVAVPEVSIFGYDKAEDFEDTEVGERPDGFADMSGGFTAGGYFKAVETDKGHSAEFYAMEGSAGNRISVPLQKEYKEISTLEFDYMIKSDLGMQLNLIDSSGRAFLCMNMAAAKFDITQEESDPQNPSKVVAQNLTKNRWYNLRIESDVQGRTMDVYLDGQLVAAGAKPRKLASDSIKDITIVAGGGTAAVGERRCWIDNLYFYEGVRPSVTESSISQGDTQVDIHTSDVRLSFDCAMNSQLQDTPVVLTNMDTGENMEADCTVEGQDYIITWPGSLNYSTIYQVTFTDWAQSQYRIPAKEYTLTFTTQNNAADHPGQVSFKNVKEGDLFLEGQETVLAIAAEDEDGIRQVNLLVNNEIAGECGADFYSIPFRPLAGEQTLRLQMIDQAGTRTYSQPVKVIGGDFAVTRPEVHRENDAFSAQITARNQSSQEKAVTLILASYGERGELVDLDLKEIAVQPGESLTLRIDGLPQAQKAIAYVCGAFADLAPYMIEETLK